MKKKTSITLNQDSYLFAVKHGKRNEYIEKLLKDRRNELKHLFNFLNKSFSEEDIFLLLQAISMPAARWEKMYKTVSKVHKAALVSLWEETFLTGIKNDELIELLSGRGNE